MKTNQELAEAIAIHLYDHIPACRESDKELTAVAMEWNLPNDHVDGAMDRQKYAVVKILSGYIRPILAAMKPDGGEKRYAELHRKYCNHEGLSIEEAEELLAGIEAHGGTTLPTPEATKNAEPQPCRCKDPDTQCTLCGGLIYKRTIPPALRDWCDAAIKEREGPDDQT